MTTTTIHTITGSKLTYYAKEDAETVLANWRSYLTAGGSISFGNYSIHTDRIDYVSVRPR